MNRSDNIFSSIGDIFSNNPAFYGIFIVVLGIIFLLTAIYDAKWIFGNTTSFNIQKVQGWVNLFGRKTTRIAVGIMSLVLILTGLLITYIYAFG
ncbi:immunity 17 family protein [uncultured Dysgonomonas sp.]|uniref:Immunity protein 17 n=1 Tax=uncultured Dysgonomonas sp. TaxID=206096 RepID=A0A212K2M0_9BACT|nr:conserved hypothetical protein [uncultured Dysgonomonas sp.]